MFKLSKQPKNPIVITGFPGFGLVGSIATEFLIDHLKTESIGKMWLEDSAAVVAVHNGKLVDPIGIFYDEVHNIVIVHGLVGGQGTEWQIANEIIRLCEMLDAKEILPLEGVSATSASEEPTAYYFATSDEKKEVFKKLGLEPMTDGVIMGATSAMLVKLDRPISSLFIQSHVEMPDSKAAAKLVSCLNRYLNLGVDETPLIETAKIFEDKLKGILERNKEAQDQKEKKMLSYVG